MVIMLIMVITINICNHVVVIMLNVAVFNMQLW